MLIRKILILITLISQINSIFAQNSKIDSLKSALEIQDEKQQISTLNKLALECIGRFPKEGVNYAEKAIKIAKKYNLETEIASSYNNLGRNYRNQNNHQKANENYLKALQIYDKLNMKKDQGTLLNNIGVIYLDMDNFQLALSNYLKAEEIFIKIKNEEGLALTYNNIAIVYSYQEKYKEAIENFNKSLAIEIKRNNILGIGECYNNIAALYYFEGNTSESIKYFIKSLEIDKQFDNKKGIATSLSNLGELYTEINDFKKAEETLLKVVEISKEINSNHDLETALLNLAGLYERQQQFKKAFQYYKEFNVLKDSIFTIEKNQQIVELQTKYETEKKDADLKLKTILIDKQSLQIEKSNQQKILLLIVLGVILLFFILFYNWYKLKQKEKLDREIIKEREMGIQAVFFAQEQERKKIATELHDGIGQQLTGLKMNWQSISKQIQDQDKVELLSKTINSAYEDVREISHRIMPKTLQEFGLISALEDMFSNSFNLTAIQYNFEYFGFEDRVDSNYELNIFRIAQEITTNILKHAEATELHFQLTKTKQNIVFTATDNGKGFDVTMKNGIGITNIKSRLNSLNGNLVIESNETGSTFIARIPLKN